MNRNLSLQITNGIYNGPNPTFGNYLFNNYAGGLGTEAWESMPAFIMGVSNYNPQTTQTGGNLSAVEVGANQLAQKAGLDSAPTGSPSGSVTY
jgi:hypothetical protein